MNLLGLWEFVESTEGFLHAEFAEEAGVEPTRRDTRLDGFEGRAPRRGRCSSAVEPTMHRSLRALTPSVELAAHPLHLCCIRCVIDPVVDLPRVVVQIE